MSCWSFGNVLDCWLCMVSQVGKLSRSLLTWIMIAVAVSLQEYSRKFGALKRLQRGGNVQDI